MERSLQMGKLVMLSKRRSTVECDFFLDVFDKNAALPIMITLRIRAKLKSRKEAAFSKLELF